MAFWLASDPLLRNAGGLGPTGKLGRRRVPKNREGLSCFDYYELGAGRPAMAPLPMSWEQVGGYPMARWPCVY